MNRQSLEFISRPFPLYMIGDSHSLIFKDLLFKDNQLNQYFITRDRYCPGVVAQNFTDAKRELHHSLQHMLYAEKLLVPYEKGMKPLHSHTSEYAEDLTRAMESHRSEPHLVIFAGELDLRHIFLKQFTLQQDFVLPPDIAVKCSALHTLPSPSNPEIVVYDLVLKLASQILDPLFTGIKQLKAMGFKQLYLHSVPPPTLDDQRFQQVNQFYCSALMRYKSALLFNHLIQKCCQQETIEFIDLWPDVTIDGILSQQFSLDGIHLNKAAAFITVEKVIHALKINHQNTQAARRLYHYSYNQSKAHLQNQPGAIDYQAYSNFVKDGYLSIELDSTKVDNYFNSLEFTLDFCQQHMNLEWIGASTISGIQGLKTAQKTRKQLSILLELLYDYPVKQSIQSCLGTEFRILNFIPMLYQGKASIPIPPDENFIQPEGVLRGFIFADDSEIDSLSFYKKSGLKIDVQIHSAQILILNSEVISIPNFQAGNIQKLTEIFIGCLLPEQSNFGISTHLNYWPVEPLNITKDALEFYQLA